MLEQPTAKIKPYLIIKTCILLILSPNLRYMYSTCIRDLYMNYINTTSKLNIYYWCIESQLNSGTFIPLRQ